MSRIFRPSPDNLVDGPNVGIMWGTNGHPAHGGSPYVAATTSYAAQLNMLISMGLRQYRIDIDSDDAFHLQIMSDMTAAATPQTGITILPCLNPNPLSGAYDSEALAYTFGFNQANHLATLSPTLKLWEVGNEWETRIGAVTGQGSFITDYDPVAYAKVRGLVRGMFDGIRAANGANKIAFGSAGGGGWGMMDGLWADGVRWDVTVEHFYSSDGTVDIRALSLAVGLTDKLALLRDHFGKPIWMDEFNYYNSTDAIPNRGTVANYLTTTMAQYDSFAATYNLKGVCIYELMDEPQLAGREAGFGLTTGGGKNPSGDAVYNYLITHPSKVYK